MPAKPKMTKKEKAAAATITSKESAASKLKIQSKRTITVTDQEIEASLHTNLLELAQHSHTCFEFACKNMTRTGKGCVFWLFPDYETSIKKSTDTTGSECPPVQYHSKERAMASEYMPVIEMIEKYEPDNAFVALVAIRTGDRRDSLMKVMIIGANTQLQMTFTVSICICITARSFDCFDRLIDWYRPAATGTGSDDHFTELLCVCVCVCVVYTTPPPPPPAGAEKIPGIAVCISV